MADATNYIKNEFINWLTDAQSFDSPPSSLWLALHDGPPGDDALNNEVNAGGYSRYQTTVPDDWNQPATGEFENVNDFVFDEATENWGDVTHFSLWDGSSDTDNALAQDSLLSTVTIENGDSPVFRSGNLTGTFE